MSMHFRPKIQNGTISKRPRSSYSYTRISPSTTHLPKSAASHLPKSAARHQAARQLTMMNPAWDGPSVGELAQTGLSVLGLDAELNLPETTVRTPEKSAARIKVLGGLVLCGIVLASGFMFSLRDHFKAYAFGKEEVALKEKMDQAKTEHKQLEARLQQAASPAELERAAQQSLPLSRIALEQKKAAVAAKKITTTERAATAEKARKKRPHQQRIKPGSKGTNTI